MTLMIELAPAEQARLTAAARQEGLDPAELARRLVTEHLPPLTPEEQDPTLALFAQWDEEDAQMTSEEVEAARREFERFKQSLNAERARAGARIIYPSAGSSSSAKLLLRQLKEGRCSEEFLRP